MKMAVFGKQRSDDFMQKWWSVKGFVLGTIGTKEANCANEAGFLRVASTLYEVELTDTQDFVGSIDELFTAIRALSKGQRKSLRKRNIGVLDVEVRPPSRTLRKALNNSRKVVAPPQARKTRPRINAAPTVRSKEEFYKSWEWRTLRMEVLKEHGARCQCCGATPTGTALHGAPVRIVVDHIKSLAKHWDLRLTRSNLQVLCDECNQGKGAWDETDWREADPLTAEYRAVMGNPWGSA
jgi:5-methylcytosine-specific restriction endonuclease McrA